MIGHPWRRVGALGVLQRHHQHIRTCAPHTARTFGTLTKRNSDALRILFCGSDAFSCASLAALHAEHRRNEELVESIEVMVQPGKRVGRGFTKLPRGTNLIVAVSFGLFVPPRILSSARYGGLNVHPSLLPHLRGPAPIHHAYLRGDPFTGVSLQTLDPRAFDHGTVLAQTPEPGIPIAPGQTFAQLRDELAARGAEMLVQGLRDRVHVPPHEVATGGEGAGGGGLVHAPKMSKADAEVRWAEWRAEDWRRRMSVFGAAWTRCAVAAAAGQEKKRVLFTKGGAADAVAGREEEEERTIRVFEEGAADGGREVRVRVDEASGTCYVEDAEGAWVAVERAKLEGEREKDAAAALRTLFRDVA
ncbi:Methionine tRNA Formyltransferase-like protein [Cordyceps fumosorosea ARSEF 2679]|uniref:methionyl-tRNA formyltransferase n=1 Tax=Cordyceps fumosorosea (strain ARSEF 2679) TaxID=1081104 RepID=A0A167QIM1_CORFA|nr:Methionine tRNA Formyltransferase-like protein [Cordyceps fumosorosea ARSEF 2679]OAA57673.1 Methionine tRNA Formyltransferase-like protein [Cordyceps fumosorosea ARSEF 2679]